MSYPISPESTLPDMFKPAVSPLPAHLQRASRFALTRRFRLMRGCRGVLGAVLPGVAARMAYAQLATPPRAALRDWQHALRQHAVTRWLPFGGAELAVMDWGKGPTVLMVHGWGGHATDMGCMIGPLVRAGFRVVAFDAPAHGKSSGRSADLVQFAAAIAAVAGHAGPLHAVVAHGLGASMAMYAQRDWGTGAARMVLVSPLEHFSWFIDSFGERMGIGAQVLTRVRGMLETLYGGRLDWARMSVLDMVRTTRSAILVVHDEDDQEIPFEHGLALAGTRPDVQLKRTRGYGHHLVLRSASVIDSIVKFISH